ncbi:hypothetical protein INT45_013105 [Circinella minor]|uniref:3'-5' exonuclease n=1 Tax=Circinella minor TaxID=1195481 RepID=A0A8H7RWG8_9FUNG|nr:hypothetical protein INT45_013105 [Circinella minor]
MARTKETKNAPGTKKPGPKPKSAVNQGTLPVNWFSNNKINNNKNNESASEGEPSLATPPRGDNEIEDVEHNVDLGKLISLVDSGILEEDNNTSIRTSQIPLIAEFDNDDSDWETDNDDDSDIEDDGKQNESAHNNSNSNNIDNDNDNDNPNRNSNNKNKRTFLHKYFLSIQERLVREKKDSSEALPAEYHRGTFWILPPDPFFALCNPSPEILALRADEKPNCTSHLTINGYPKNPPAHRVIDLKRNFYVMSMTYICTNKHCKKTLSAHNKGTIRQLPLYLQQEFPVYFTHRTGVSKDVGDVFRPYVQNALGPKRFQKVLQELQRLTHARLEFQYLNYINSRCTSPTLEEIINPPTFQTFSPYEDKDGYAGYIPSGQYLHTIYTVIINEIRHLIDKQMMVLGGRLLKGDHTFKIIKHLGRIDGSPTFLAVYTVCNKYEEIRMQLLVPTKSLKHLKFAFDSMRDAYNMYGYDHPEIFFIDNATGEQAFLSSVLPSLIQDVVPVKLSEIKPNNQFLIVPIPEDVNIIILSTYNEIKRTFERLLEDKPFVVGFDCEWPYDKYTGTQGKLALIQIATSHNIWILKLTPLSELPDSLQRFLQDGDIKKVGRAVGGDLAKIHRDFNVLCQGDLELGRFCKERDVIHDARMSLADICKKVLGCSLPKVDDIRLSDWDSDILSPQQIEYAARDAWAGLDAFNAVITRYFPVGKLVLKPLQGIHVSVQLQKLWEAVAYGKLAKQDRVLGDITVRKNQAIVTIKQVLKPAIILKAHKKALREFGDTPFNVIIDLKNLRTSKPTEVPSQNISRNITSTTATATDNNPVLDDLINSSIDNNDTDSEDDDSIDDHEESTSNNNSNRPHSVSVTHEQINSSTTSQPSTISSNPLPSRILKDAFHLMDMIRVSRKHGLVKEFARHLRDAIFLIDKNNKRLIEEYLKTKHMSFDMMMDKNPTWVLRRVKRVIPPGKDLYPVVKKVFDTYRYLRCAKTGRTLFDDEAWRQSENVLNTIQLGHVSDPPGISFYFEIGKDKNNLPLYRCSRGTNSLEGEVHQNIIRKFMSFGASPELADAVIADYRLRHNIDVGSFNRYGRVHKGHYEPWLTQHILDLFDEKMKTTYKNSIKNSIGINAMNSESRKEVHDIVLSEDKKRKVPSANKPSTNKVPRYENMTIQASSSLHIAIQPALTNTSDSNRLSSSSNSQMSAIEPLPSYPLQPDLATQYGSSLTNSNIPSSSLSSSIIKQSITRPLVSWNTNHSTSLPDATHQIYFPSTTRSTITATSSLLHAQDTITNIQTLSQVSSQQPTLSRGIQPSRESSEGPLFIVSNVHLLKYCGHKN